MNSSYQRVAALHAGNGASTDLHEFQITPQHTALSSGVEVVKQDLSSVGGSSDGTVCEPVVQELDIGTSQVLWEWHGLGPLPLSASYMPLAIFPGALTSST